MRARHLATENRRSRVWLTSATEKTRQRYLSTIEVSVDRLPCNAMITLFVLIAGFLLLWRGVKVMPPTRF